ncbi:DNA-binding protein [Pandoraea sp. NPDC090278]|uniref:helix-turn-helix domain-containing transcriptional regulator n=1 Tax=Pandoraea sp. NPDC090278 TaxID=3364391 RepID=UPI00383BC7C6
MAHIELTPFDASEYLDTDEVISEYITAALEENDIELLMAVIADIKKAKDRTM